MENELSNHSIAEQQAETIEAMQADPELRLRNLRETATYAGITLVGNETEEEVARLLTEKSQTTTG